MGFGLLALFLLKTQCHIKNFDSTYILHTGGGHYLSISCVRAMDHFCYAFRRPSNSLPALGWCECRMTRGPRNSGSIVTPCLCHGVACLVLSGIACLEVKHSTSLENGDADTVGEGGGVKQNCTQNRCEYPWGKTATPFRMKRAQCSQLSIKQVFDITNYCYMNHG